MRRFVITVCLVLCGAAPVTAEDGFESLFNGQDLTGWNGNPAIWSVQDGVIQGRAAGLKYNQFLIWSGTASDFELRLEFQLEGDNNSGVQYRSQPRETGEWAVQGYQADIHPNPSYCGMLYDEGGRGIIAERGQKVILDKDGQKDVAQLEVPVEPINLSEWHELTIIAQGPNLTHKIDGVTTVEIVDQEEAARDLDGLIALQAHVGKPMTVRFRNIRIKHLTEKRDAASDEGQGAAMSPGTNSQSSGATAAAELPQWIGTAGEDGKPGEVCFRHLFSIDTPVADAKLLLDSRNAVSLFLDQHKLTDHNGQTFTALDVTPYFRGKNAVGKHVLTVQSHGSGAPQGLIVQLVVTSEDKTVTTILSGEDWKTRPQPVVGWRKPDFDDSSWANAKVLAAGEAGRRSPAELLELAQRLKEPTATPIADMKVADGFTVDLLYSVPPDVQGSWVAMCVEPQGRLIVCDQYGGLFRVTPPGILGAQELILEPIDVPIGEAQGLLWAFDSLYVVVNKGRQYESGLYRVRDTDGDDRLDTVETLRLLPGSGGEHGPHALLLSPDGESLTLICGNKVFLTEFASSRVPKIWDEDVMIPRLYGKGFMKGVPAPGGYVSRIDPDGKNWELVSVGYRNPYDAAFTADGELLAYDADMEWDMNTPWYRPTRICHVLSGVDYGWRNGGGKMMEHFPETLPPVVNIGPGSPTGVAMGYGARFPGKYQAAMYINDWSYGKIYAVHLTPSGASYTATFEDFVVGTPLPLTDIVINPVDGAMYFAIGGRRVQSGLYRVRYTGSESTEPFDARDSEFADARQLRRELEALHVGDHPNAVEIAWPHLASEDRVIRTAARIAIEHRPGSEWMEKAFSEPHPQARLEALLALCRQQVRKLPQSSPGTDESQVSADLKGYDREAIDTVPPAWDAPSSGPEGDAGLLQARIFSSLSQLDWSELTTLQRYAGLRILQLAILRLGQPADLFREGILRKLESVLPTSRPDMNTMILDLLVSLQSSKAVEQGMALLNQAPSQEEQMNYAKSLRFARFGWSDELLENYFQWFVKAQGYRGGVGFQLYVDDIRKDALNLLSEEQKTRLQPILEAKPSGPVNPFAAEPRPFVKSWKMDDLLPLVGNGLQGRSFENGRKMFGAANCFSCHRFNGEGGAMGPDLTSLAGRFSSRDILESILEPSKVISDQYAAVQIMTLDGQVVVGRIINLFGDTLRVNTNMLDPEALEVVDRRRIEMMVNSPNSMMPGGLLDTFEEEEILDLLAFLVSRGDRNHPAFAQQSR